MADTQIVAPGAAAGTPPANPAIVEPAPAPKLPAGANGANGAAVAVPDWAKDFEPEGRELVGKKKWEKPGDMARAYANLERFAYRDGADKVVIPDEHTAAEDRAAFYAKLGVPEKPEDYQFAAPKEAVEYSDELAQWFRKTAHKHNLPREAAQALHDEFVGNWIERNNALLANESQTHEKWKGDLHREFGAAYDARVEIARRAVRTFGDDNLVELLNQSGLGDHPSMVRAFARIGMKLGEQALVTGDEGGNYGMTPGEAREKISAVRRDAKHPYNDRNSPEHSRAVEQMRTLYEAAYPDRTDVTNRTSNR